ncbi:MAG TPA: NAD(P)H-binding protein [Cyclobacteriaceae bacterium]|nr:NAD(P)H-binding protein [Cyclobacteriaceae bacterium]MCB9237176.1 NAD(P)H-binding protein [Flammeovirgaceae bacterium]MCB0500006.1 NAD(P)H-binding protein [Cyclobacteriaceae bacterium]MCO5270885.1 NAD(P)H-binding protein [Cyclobacteriaceae bacterium]MCW5901829.1 NAD(P)H-binding protein [Cyclobacteriaceae bacterium]
MKTALLAGGTGLIGSQLLQLLARDDAYGTVKCLTRNALPVTHEKIEAIQTNGSDLNGLAASLVADDVFCCLGTTIKKAKTKEAFRKIDFDYPLHLANLSKAQGARQFLLVSALGANPSSSVFYNQVKGEVEEAIAAIGFEAYHVFRPSLLLGARPEERTGEDAAKIFFKWFGFLLPQQYKAIDSAKVARAMLAMANKNGKGTFVYESKLLQGF